MKVIIENNFESNDSYNFIVKDAGIITRGVLSKSDAKEIYELLAKDFKINEVI